MRPDRIHVEMGDDGSCGWPSTITYAVTTRLQNESNVIIELCLFLPHCFANDSVGEWLSLVEHLVRDQGVGGSNPLSPTNIFKDISRPTELQFGAFPSGENPPFETREGWASLQQPTQISQ